MSENNRFLNKKLLSEFSVPESRKQTGAWPKNGPQRGRGLTNFITKMKGQLAVASTILQELGETLGALTFRPEFRDVKTPANRTGKKMAPKRGTSYGVRKDDVAGHLLSSRSTARKAAPKAPIPPPPKKGRWARQLPIPPTHSAEEVMKRLLGPGGSHVKEIALRYGAKLRVRGVGSGHVEGRRRQEAQVPLHLCVSAATESAMDGAVAEAKSLISRATGTSTSAVVTRYALVNEGKISESASLFLSSWAKDNEVEACLVSEGALAGRERATEGGYSWAVPLKQSKGGAGFLLRGGPGQGEKVKPLQDQERRWSIASWKTAFGTGLISCYINPESARTREILDAFLAGLTALCRTHPRCVIGGDFNAPSGSTQRKRINRWCEEQGLSLANPGVATHFVSGDAQGTDLDLILARGVPVKMLDGGAAPERGHSRQLFEIVEGPGQVPKPVPGLPAWGRLSCPKTQERYVTAVKAALHGTNDLNSALQRAASATLGTRPGPTGGSRPLPTAVRAEVRELRKLANRYPRGSPGYQDISRQIGAVMRRHRHATWLGTLVRLASARTVEKDTWRLVNHLRKSNPTAKMVGIPDGEIKDTFATIYQSNRLRREDWSLPMTPETSGLGEGGVPELDTAFTTQEVEAVLRALPNQKAPGLDGVPHEAYKALSRDPHIMRVLAAEASALLAGAAVPPLSGRLVAIPKKGTPERAADTRPLMMLPTWRKVIERLVANRITRLAQLRGSDGFYPLQGGFRRGLRIERQLVLAQVAIDDARDRGRPLRMVGLDLVKAFDRIPKEFVTRCASGYLRGFCPKLADLVVRLTLSPFEARVGGEGFGVHTGVPQGGILSPWLFAMAMNDLALRLAGAGGYTVGGQQLGTLLYADDILLVDDNLETSESRCRLTKEWVEEWGGSIHPTKTQWLDINATSSPAPEGLGTSDHGGAIDFLGVLLTRSGVKPKVGTEVYVDTLSAVRCIIEGRGVAPAPALQIVRSVAWAKIAHGVAVTLPCTAKLTSNWLAAARLVLNTFKQVHRAEMQRELGLLHHPAHWVCRAVIRFYGTALTTDRDPALRQALVETVASPSSRLRQGIESALEPSGVSWAELASVPVPDLLRKAEGRIREWSRGHILAEARRLGLQEGENSKLWRELTDAPKKYLFEENARYGFMFRRCTFAPPDIEPSACFFCGAPSRDSGRHLFECGAARAAVPLPASLLALAPEPLEQTLLLEDHVPRERIRVALQYMRDLYEARAKIRNRSSPAEVVRRQHISNPDYFKGPPPARTLPDRGRGARRRRRSSVDERGETGASTAKRTCCDLQSFPHSPVEVWPPADSPVETDPMILLDEPALDCHDPDEELLVSGPVELGVPSGAPDSAAAEELDIANVDSLESPAPETQTSVTRPPDEPPQPPANGPKSASGQWTEEEGLQLARAAIALGRDAVPSKLEPFVPTRTQGQIKSRLTTAGHRTCIAKISGRQRDPSASETREPPVTADAPEGLPALAGPPRPTPSPLQATTGSTPSLYNRGAWSRDEDERLIAALREHGLDASGRTLEEAVRTRHFRQCFDRKREQRILDALNATPPIALDTSAFSAKGAWSVEEIGRLETAINQLGDYGPPAEIASRVGTRSSGQVAAKITDLVKTGKLKRTGPSTFTIQ